MKKIFILLCLISLISIGFLYYIKQPTQILNQWIESIKDRDYEKFNKLTNLDELKDNTIKSISSKLESNENNDILEEVDKKLKSLFLDLFLIGYQHEIQQNIDNYFLKNDDRFLFFSQFVETLNFDKLSSKLIKQNQNQTLFEVDVFSEKYLTNFKIIVELNKKDESGWKIVNVVNFNQLTSKIYDLERLRRNQSVSQKTKEMSRYLQIKEYSYIDKNKTFIFFDSPEISHRIKIKNVSNQGISKIVLKITFKENDLITVEHKLIDEHFLNIGEERNVDFRTYDPFLKRQVERGYVPELNHVLIEFESGETILNEDNQSIEFYE